jgi:hypothetical protein
VTGPTLERFVGRIERLTTGRRLRDEDFATFQAAIRLLALTLIDAGNTPVNQAGGPEQGTIVGDYSPNLLYAIGLNLIKRFSGESIYESDESMPDAAEARLARLVPGRRNAGDGGMRVALSDVREARAHVRAGG